MPPVATNNNIAHQYLKSQQFISKSCRVIFKQFDKIDGIDLGNEISASIRYVYFINT